MAKKIIISDFADGENTSADTMYKGISLRQAQAIAEGYVSDVQRSQKYNEDASYEIGEIEKIVKSIISQDVPAGAPMAFHNLAVIVAQIELYQYACDLLEKGLSLFPMSVDLLADYLVYGIDCGRFDKCGKYYEILCSIDKDEWTWRAFSFSIAYFKRLRERTADMEARVAYKNNIMQLATEYRENLPYNENSYREYAEIFSSDPEKKLAILREAMDNERIGACPACAFRCADILFEQKRYSEAMKAIERSRADAKAQMQGGINEYYLSFLSGLCKIALAEVEKRELAESDVLEIYSDFDMALYGLSGDFRKTVRTRVQFLEKQTKVRVSDEHENILELLGY